MNQERFYDYLIKHYRETGRDLPWRQSLDPYSIWVSEVILQQTRVVQGIDYFMTFIRYFPDIETLANAQESEVLKVWQGLGYYSRALNMHSAAKQMVENWHGKFPDTFDDILALKGIGNYTASAIASIAFGLHLAAIDGNVKRVASRIYGITEPLNSSINTKLIAERLNEVIKYYNPGEFNQAMMELGATLCKPRNPLCSDCPVKENCYAQIHNLQASIPVVIPKKKPLKVNMDFMFLECDGFTFIHKRNKTGIWKGLYEFVSAELPGISAKMPEQFLDLIKDPNAIVVKSVREYQHQLTHRTIFAKFWHLSVLPANIVKERPGMLRVPISELANYPVHRLMQHFLTDSGIIEEKKTKKS